MNTLSYSSKNEKFCLELDRVKLLLEKAGNPDRDLSIIHIAGTNGKGSVCAFLEEGLTDAKINCGRFSSPDLFSAEDTITVDKKPIGKNCLAGIIEKLNPLCDEIKKELGKAPSSFEILFVAALVYFKRKKCKKVILECGMGGIGDATNAILKSDISVLTNIDLDHKEYLGKNLEEITKNKCGILREGQKVFSAVQNELSEYVIIEECKKKNCFLSFVPPLEICETDFLNVIAKTEWGETRLSLAGVHQANNAALSCEIMKELEIDKTSIINALSNAVNRARLEKISDKTYFDGAHNPAGVKCLVDSINAANPKGKIIFAIGFMADKDITGCLDELKHLKNKNFEIYTATVFSNQRSETSENLAFLARRKGFKAKCFSNIFEAVSRAEKDADTVFAFGSLYMYKEIFTEGKYENR